MGHEHRPSRSRRLAAGLLIGGTLLSAGVAADSALQLYLSEEYPAVTEQSAEFSEETARSVEPYDIHPASERALVFGGLAVLGLTSALVVEGLNRR